MLIFFSPGGCSLRPLYVEDVSSSKRFQSRDFARGSLMVIEVQGWLVVLVLVVVHRDAEKLLGIEFFLLVVLFEIGFLTDWLGQRGGRASEYLVYSSVKRPGYVVRLVLVPVNGILQFLGGENYNFSLKSQSEHVMWIIRPRCVIIMLVRVICGGIKALYPFFPPPHSLL